MIHWNLDVWKYLTPLTMLLLIPIAYYLTFGKNIFIGFSCTMIYLGLYLKFKSDKNYYESKEVKQ